MLYLFFSPTFELESTADVVPGLFSRHDHQYAHTRVSLSKFFMFFFDDIQVQGGDGSFDVFIRGNKYL